MILLQAAAFPLRAQTHGIDAAVPPEPYAQAVECLSLAIAHEAGYEPVEGQRAVAEVVLNRVRTPGYPKTICAVVFQGSTRRTGCQFTFTCDGALRRRVPDRVLAAARTIAEQAIDGRGAGLVGRATNYHAYYVTPRWAGTLTRITQIGAHIFYRRTGAVAVPLASPAVGADAAPAAIERDPAVFAPWGLAPPTITPTSHR